MRKEFAYCLVWKSAYTKGCKMSSDKQCPHSWNSLFSDAVAALKLHQ